MICTSVIHLLYSFIVIGNVIYITIQLFPNSHSFKCDLFFQYISTINFHTIFPNDSLIFLFTIFLQEFLHVVFLFLIKISDTICPHCLILYTVIKKKKAQCNEWKLRNSKQCKFNIFLITWIFFLYICIFIYISLSRWCGLYF